MSTANNFPRWMVAITFALAAAMAQAGGQAQSSGSAEQSGAAQSEVPEQSSTGAGDSASAAGGGTGAVSELKASDRRSMNELARANIAEIEIAQLALQRSKDPAVQSFAQRMVDDHTQALDDLKQLAQEKGVTLPTAPDAKHQALAKRLSRLSSQQFDRQYMQRAGTHDHRAAIALFERVSKNASDPDLRAYADKTLPVIQQHLQAATEKSAAERSESAGQ